MAKKPQAITAICESSSQLKYLTERTNKLSQFNSVLQNLLPEQLKGHCYLANITTDSIIVQTSSSQFASLLRFDAPRICKAMSQHIAKPVTRLNVKVSNNVQLSQEKPKQAKNLSQKAANSIDQIADLIDDGSLKTALNKLAKRRPK